MDTARYENLDLRLFLSPFHGNSLRKSVCEIILGTLCSTSVCGSREVDGLLSIMSHTSGSPR